MKKTINTKTRRIDIEVDSMGIWLHVLENAQWSSCLLPKQKTKQLIAALQKAVDEVEKASKP